MTLEVWHLLVAAGLAFGWDLLRRRMDASVRLSERERVIADSPNPVEAARALEYVDSLRLHEESLKAMERAQKEGPSELEDDMMTPIVINGEEFCPVLRLEDLKR